MNEENEDKLVIVKETGGVSILGVITLVLLIGKVFFGLNLSWWGVFAPLWLPPVLVVGIVIGIFGLVLALAMGLVGWEAYQEYKLDKKIAKHEASFEEKEEWDTATTEEEVEEDNGK